MTKPKKWFLESNESGVVLKSSEYGELIKKINAKQVLGRVLKVEVPNDEDVRKFTSDESLLVSGHFSYYLVEAFQ